MHLVSLVAGSAQEECNFGVIAARIQHMDIGRSEGVHFGRVVVLSWFVGLVYGLGEPTFVEARALILCCILANVLSCIWLGHANERF